MTTTHLDAGLLERLAELRCRCPEMRFGQILATVGTLAEDDTGHSLWEVEDTEFAVALDRFAADLARRSSNPFVPGPLQDQRRLTADEISEAQVP
jgi:hypothetical protein